MISLVALLALAECIALIQEMRLNPVPISDAAPGKPLQEGDVKK